MSDRKTSPWLRGIVDTLVGAHLIHQSDIPTKNRLVVILIDTAFETACRSYLKHKARIKLSSNHEHRENLVSTVKSKLPDIDEEVWRNIDYYYTEIRCDFYHQSAGKTLTDNDLLDYQETVEFVIDRAFGVRIQDLVRAQISALQQPASPGLPEHLVNDATLLRRLAVRVDKVLFAVATISPSSADEVNAFFRRMGESLRVKQKEFSGIVRTNSGTKKFYFYNQSLKRWELSGLGKFRLQQLLKGESNE